MEPGDRETVGYGARQALREMAAFRGCTPNPPYVCNRFAHGFQHFGLGLPDDGGADAEQREVVEDIHQAVAEFFYGVEFFVHFQCPTACFTWASATCASKRARMARSEALARAVSASR